MYAKAAVLLLLVIASVPISRGSRGLEPRTGLRDGQPIYRGVASSTGHVQADADTNVARSRTRRPEGSRRLRDEAASFEYGATPFRETILEPLAAVVRWVDQGHATIRQVRASSIKGRSRFADSGGKRNGGFREGESGKQTFVHGAGQGARTPAGGGESPVRLLAVVRGEWLSIIGRAVNWFLQRLTRIVLVFSRASPMRARSGRVFMTIRGCYCRYPSYNL